MAPKLMLPDAPATPHPFAVTARQYADAAVAARLSGGHEGALARYAKLFREGLTEQRVLSVITTPPSRIHESESPEGRVIKFTSVVPGPDAPGAAGKTFETESVLIPMIGRRRLLQYTLCVSSQVGCAMGCTFCQTAQMGLIRSLTPVEIVAQWFTAAHHFKVRPANIVFMGMGEPMDNLDAVIDAISVLTDRRGPNVPMSRITVSTVGRVDGIERLGKKIHETEWHRLGLAISLNAPNDEIRSKIMPINRAVPLARLREALLAWPLYGGAKFCVEYVLIPGVNDAREHAAQIADFMKGAERPGSPYPGAKIPGLINLIPYNPRDNSPWPAPTEESVDQFLEWLHEEGVFAKRRRTKGRDTMAACGQLGNSEIRRKDVYRPITVSV
jgi:23S rRNA (adenine2503-C2)-methyltransferase